MADDNDSAHLSATEARGGSTPGVTRYVLGASLILVVVAFAVVYFLYQ